MSRIRPLALTLLVLAFPAASARAQDDPEFFNKPKTPAEFWRAVQFEVGVGQYELASKYLGQMLAINPDDKSFVEIIEKAENGPPEGRGLVPFLRLRNVPKWSNNPEAQTQARQDVEAVIAKATGALKNHLSNPERILYFIKQLTATPEEAEFAETELRRSGAAATPFMLGVLQTNPPDEQRAAILTLLPTLDRDTVPAQIAFLQIKDANLQLAVLNALAKRPDLAALRGRAETDITPTLWYVVGRNETPGLIREKATAVLEATLGVAIDKRSPANELTAAAVRFADHKAIFGNADAVNVWRWDDAQQVLIPPPTPPFTTGPAEEYFGLKYTRWALELKPNDEAARILFLTLAVNGAFARTNLDTPLLKASPAVYDLAATAPAELLVRTLGKTLRDRNSGAALGLIQVIGDRAEVKSAPRPLIDALTYKDDPRVAFAAAVALARMPDVPNQSHGQMLEIFRRALTADPKMSGVGTPRPKAMIADRNPRRVQTLARLLDRLGFDAVQATTGNDMLAQLAKTGDFNVVFMDHSIGGPMVPDLLGSLRADGRFAWMPVFLVASTPRAEFPDLDMLLQRLALQIAASDEVAFPPPTDPVVDVGIAPPAPNQVDLQRARRAEDRAARMSKLVEERTGRLERLVEATGMVLPTSVKLRIEELTILALAADTVLSPGLETRITGLRKLIVADPIRAVRDEKVFLDRLIQTADRIDNEMTAPILARVDRIGGQLFAAESFVSTESSRDLVLETKLRRLIGPYTRVTVVPESFSEAALKKVLVEGFVAPSAQPRSEAALREEARTAMIWLRRMALGEVAGYDVRVVEGAIRSQLASADLEMATLAADAAARLPFKEAQRDLANLVTRDDRPIELRRRAADSLVLSMQAFGRLLGQSQIGAIVALANGEADVELKAKAALAVGTLGTNPKFVGARFQQYVPPLPAAAATLPPPKDDEPKKAPE